MRGGARKGAGRIRQTIELDPETARLLRHVRDQWRANAPQLAELDEAAIVRELIEREARAQELAAKVRAATHPPR